MKKYISILILFSVLCTQNIVFAIKQEDITVKAEKQILKSRLKKEYVGYSYKITNNSKSTINIVNAQIVNGIDGNNAYSTVSTKGGKSVGILWAVCGPAGVFSLGVGWLVGIIATPIVLIVGNKKDKRTKKESTKYTNTILSSELTPGESVNAMTLIPKDAKPQLNISIYDKRSKEYQSFTY